MTARVASASVGSFAENVYVIAAAESNDCVVIDPGSDGEMIANAIKAAGFNLRYILITHGHADHTGAIAVIKRELGGTIAAHHGDVDMVANPDPGIVQLLGDFEQPPAVELVLHGGEIIEVADLKIRVIATPGHTPGSVSYLCENLLFTGDTLFKGSIGRYDLPGGNGELELLSIREHLLTLPEETVVLPGHGPQTTIREESANNPFLTSRVTDEDDQAGN
ncbi:MAG: MBL fold metallo-hydrolase [SAR202 cluster bacterium]|nr:MBL fold metallo-hydrolase [SAR202 cluster bacterium]